MDLIYCRIQFFWGNRLSNDILKKIVAELDPNFQNLILGKPWKWALHPGNPVVMCVCLFAFSYTSIHIDLTFIGW